MKVKSESEVAQWRPTLSDPVDCSLPGSSIHGIFQARVPEWVVRYAHVQFRGADSYRHIMLWMLLKEMIVSHHLKP